jgi:hypothetical protein
MLIREASCNALVSRGEEGPRSVCSFIAFQSRQGGSGCLTSEATSASSVRMAITQEISVLFGKRCRH